MLLQWLTRVTWRWAGCGTSGPLIGTLHDRMPVILAKGEWAKWLGEVPATNDELKALLLPFKDDALTMWPVNRQKVGNVRNKVCFGVE
jgi:putative SOS response-associated peptidase YedK